jgi:uncharacterized protein YkwD
MTKYESQIVAGMNREREKRGLPALAADKRLTAAARVHSRDMAKGDFLDHRGSDGSRPGDRIKKQGYHWSFYAENVACGPRTGTQALKSWMESKPHRDNVLNGTVEHVGISVSRRAGTRCIYHWTAVFAAGD